MNAASLSFLKIITFKMTKSIIVVTHFHPKIMNRSSLFVGFNRGRVTFKRRNILISRLIDFIYNHYNTFARFSSLTWPGLTSVVLAHVANGR